MRINSQSSPCHQCFYIVSVDLQGLVIFIHRFHMTAVFEEVHTCTYTEKKEKKGYIHIKKQPEGEDREILLWAAVKIEKV